VTKALFQSALVGGLTLACFASDASGRSEENETDKKKLVQEETEDYYEKWLRQDVIYVITENERAVFKSLSTDEERESFIEQFWRRRDPDLRTAFNEFKEEHYRRVAYANDNFTAGQFGWQTDRGRIYILHGPPNEKKSYPTGGYYFRPMHEGGGDTTTYPFEVWHYRYIEGVGQDVELEFVDSGNSGQYELTYRPDDKDAFLWTNAGMTLYESLTGASKSTRLRRPYDDPFRTRRQKDMPFERFRIYANVQRAPEIKYKDLQEMVRVNVSYEDLPFRVVQDHFRLNEDQVLVPLSVEVENHDLTFVPEEGVQVAKMAVYGMVTSMTKEVVAEFEDDVTTTYSPESLQRGLLERSIYQKLLALPAKTRYKLDLVVKDLNSNKAGVFRQAIVPRKYGDDNLKTSSIILSDTILPVREVSEQDEMFVLGNIKVIPRLSKSFPEKSRFGVYLQVYNAALDQASLKPSLHVTYKVSQRGLAMMEATDEAGNTVQFYSGQRVVLIRVLPVSHLDPGDYELEVRVKDLIKDEVVTAKDRFKIVDPKKILARAE
jgi:GWxTD domain-containing protein